jgi:hypothetical protein
MKMFESRFSNGDKEWQEWRNDQVEEIVISDTHTQIGGVALSQDKIPYASATEFVIKTEPSTPNDILSQGI